MITREYLRKLIPTGLLDGYLTCIFCGWPRQRSPLGGFTSQKSVSVAELAEHFAKYHGRVATI